MSYGNETRAVDSAPRATRGVNEASEVPVATLRMRLETTRETQKRTLSVLCDINDALNGTSPEDGSKRPESIAIMGIVDENEDLASTIHACVGKILRTIGPIK